MEDDCNNKPVLDNDKTFVDQISEDTGIDKHTVTNLTYILAAKAIKNRKEKEEAEKSSNPSYSDENKAGKNALLFVIVLGVALVVCLGIIAVCLFLV